MSTYVSYSYGIKVSTESSLFTLSLISLCGYDKRYGRRLTKAIIDHFSLYIALYFSTFVTTIIRHDSKCMTYKYSYSQKGIKVIKTGYYNKNKPTPSPCNIPCTHPSIPPHPTHSQTHRSINKLQTKSVRVKPAEFGNLTLKCNMAA